MHVPFMSGHIYLGEGTCVSGVSQLNKNSCLNYTNETSKQKQRLGQREKRIMRSCLGKCRTGSRLRLQTNATYFDEQGAYVLHGREMIERASFSCKGSRSNDGPKMWSRGREWGRSCTSVYIQHQREFRNL